MLVPCLGRQESVHPRAIQNKAFTIRRPHQSACICAKGAMGLLWSGPSYHCAQAGTTTRSAGIPQPHRATEEASWSLTTHKGYGQPREQHLHAMCQDPGFCAQCH